MIENLRSVEENIIKDIRNHFRLRRELNYTPIKDIRNRFRVEKETKATKYFWAWKRRTFQSTNYYKPLRVSHFWSNNYIEFENNGDRNKTLSIEEYFIKISPYLKGIINNLKITDTWKIQLTIANSFISSIDNDEH